ncbi:DUF2945 domain-containing protein [Propioniciclava soli]|uniref:DUF2945 domain-containing protein n=1 Tax=Propioniciclava soli TaxID=2775081 RepID=UPI001E580312|nr:DUF2945 domain-containing protein [Propioniciclava soli]
MTFRTGDHVSWNTPQGKTSGTVVEKRTSDFQFEGQKFTASDDDPAYVVESDSSGKQAAHKESALSKKE